MARLVGPVLTHDPTAEKSPMSHLRSEFGSGGGTPWWTMLQALMFFEEEASVPLQFSHKKAHEVPQPGPASRVTEAFAAIMREMARVAPDMVLEIETGDARTIRVTKMLVTRAGSELGTPWRQWHVGTKVYARPMEATERRRERSERANRADHRN